MAERPRQRLPFGEGLDRATGSLVVAEPVTFRDLRNVTLRQGRAALRGGLALVSTLGTTGPVIGIYDMRSADILVALVYDSSTKTVKAYSLASDGSSPALIGTVWTWTNRPLVTPRAIAADSYGKLIIAHDSPWTYPTTVLLSPGQRKVTRVYDAAAGTLTDLNGGTGLTTIAFRGVVTHLAYIVGWGYGTDADQNRPEIVRVSIAAEPTTYDLNHYFVAGQRNDPVIACQPAGAGPNGVLSVQKYSEAYYIEGYDRATFGIRPSDQHHGVVGSHATITIAGVNYRWSQSGPRMVNGPGLSEDISQPLDLAGPAVDALAILTPFVSEDNAFMAYHPVTKQLALVANNLFAYQLHLDDPSHLRWSYNKYGVEVCSAVTTRASIFYGGLLGQIYRADSTTLTDNAVEYDLYAKTDRVAPAGAGGECSFHTLYLTTKSFGGTVSLKVTPIVDDVALTAQTIVVPAGTSSGLVQVIEIALDEAYMVGGVEATRYAPRGTWIQALIETSPAVSLAPFEISLVEVEHEVVQEGRAAA